jgi:hypothetical protein
MSVQIHNPSLNASINTQTVSGQVIIDCGDTVSVSEAAAEELLTRYGFLQVVQEEFVAEPVLSVEESVAEPAVIGAAFMVEETESQAPADSPVEEKPLASMTKVELAELAKERGVEVLSTMTKKEMIEKLSL